MAEESTAGMRAALSQFQSFFETLTFTRDAVGRITQETGGLVAESTNYVRDYTYDANGNQTRLLKTGAFGVADNVLTMDDANRPVIQAELFGTTTHVYDANGSLTTSTFGALPAQTWVIDARNRVVSSDNGFGDTVDYTHDVVDRVIRLEDSFGKDRRTIYDSLDPAAEYGTPGGNIIFTTTPGAATPVDPPAPPGPIAMDFTDLVMRWVFGLTRTEQSSGGRWEYPENKWSSRTWIPYRSPAGQGRGACSETQGVLTGIGLSGGVGCGEIPANVVSPDCTSPYPVLPEPAASSCPLGLTTLVGQGLGVCSVTRGVVITTGIALSCQGRSLQLPAKYSLQGCVSPSPASPEPSASNCPLSPTTPVGQGVGGAEARLGPGNIFLDPSNPDILKIGALGLYYNPEIVVQGLAEIFTTFRNPVETACPELSSNNCQTGVTTPIGPRPGVCSVTRGVTITTGIALSCEGRNVSPQDCTSPSPALPEPSVCDWRGDQDSLPGLATSVGRQGGVHSVTQGATTVHLFIGGNTGATRTTLAARGDGEGGWGGTNFADGATKEFFATTGLGFDFAGELIGARAGPNSTVQGQAGTANIFYPRMRANHRVGGFWGNSTSRGAGDWFDGEWFEYPGVEIVQPWSALFDPNHPLNTTHEIDANGFAVRRRGA